MSPPEESDDKGMVTVDNDEAGTTRTVDVAREEAEMSRIVDEDEGTTCTFVPCLDVALSVERMVELMELELGFSLDLKQLITVSIIYFQGPWE